MKAPAAALVIGRVRGFRGRSGEVTVRVASGDAARWTRLERVGLVADGEDPAAGGREAEVEGARAYRDRLVLKLRGVDDASDAERLAGLAVVARGSDVPVLPEGVYWVDRLVGSRVDDAGGRVIGRVEDVLETGGCDLLVVRSDAGEEILVPLARAIVTEVDTASRRIRVDLPEGLAELNAPSGGAEETAAP